MSDSNGGFPSLTALLGLLAVAGYQNRDKITEWLGSRQGEAQQSGQQTFPGSGQPDSQGLGGLLGSLGGLLGGAGAGGLLNGGLGELVDKFRQAGQGDKADSWVQSGPNQEVAPNDLHQALGPEVIDAITRQTGLSRDEILSRLSKVCPTPWIDTRPLGVLAMRPDQHDHSEGAHSAFAISRSLNFWIFPVDVLGISAKTMVRGHLNAASVSRHQPMISASVAS